MKKYAIIGLICAMVGTAALPAVTSFADTTTPATTTQSSNTNTSGTTSNTASADSSSSSTTDGPVFHVASTKLLVKVGASLDLKTALNVTVTDPYDTNLQDQIKDYPTINTSKPGDYNFTMKVTDSKNKTATEVININVIGAKTDLSLPNIEPSALTQSVLDSLVEGNTTGLKISYSNYDGTSKTFDLDVTNGSDSLTFPIQMKQGALPPLLNNNQKTAVANNTINGTASTTPVAGSSTGTTPTSASTSGTTLKSTTPVAGQTDGSGSGTTDLTTNSGTKTNLPKTGMVFVTFVGGLIVACGGLLLYIKQKSKKKNKLTF